MSWPLRLLLVMLWLSSLNVQAQSQPGSQSQSSNDRLATLKTRLEQAKGNHAEWYAPKTLARATEAMQDVQKDIDKGRKPKRINEDLNTAEQLAADTEKFIASSQQELASVIRSRDDAMTANGPQLVADGWKQADERFRDAVVRIERNDVEAARRKGAEAEVLMRDVELKAIEITLLSEVRTLIAQADAKKVVEYAPRSLAAAKRYLAQAEQEIVRSRYDTSVPKQLVAQALYEVRHANYLAEQIAPLLERDSIKQQGLEQVMLDWEEPVRKLAMELDVEPRFDQGYRRPMQDLLDKVKQQREALQSAQRAVRDRDEQIADLNSEMKQLQGRLGGESEERLALQKRLSVQERLRESIARVEGMFSGDEGRAYRQSNDVVMSLNGIRFRSGKSTIEPDSFALLAKVAEAAKLFPDATLTVEGHTDNQGTESSNLLLSQDRADAVRDYLVSNLGVSAAKINSIGYGRARPVANNDNEAGRARNRRIDVVMHVVN